MSLKIHFEPAEEAMEKVNDTTLTSHLKLNQSDAEVKKLKYFKISEFYVWNKTNCICTKIKLFTESQDPRMIFRINIVTPIQEGQFYPQIFLNHKTR